MDGEHARRRALAALSAAIEEQAGRRRAEHIGLPIVGHDARRLGEAHRVEGKGKVCRDAHCRLHVHESGGDGEAGIREGCERADDHCPESRPFRRDDDIYRRAIVQFTGEPAEQFDAAARLADRGQGRFQVARRFRRVENARGRGFAGRAPVRADHRHGSRLPPLSPVRVWRQDHCGSVRVRTC